MIVYRISDLRGNLGHDLGALSGKSWVLGLMRSVRGMQRLVCGEESVLGWKESFSQGIGITGPKVRTRDKPISCSL